IRIYYLACYITSITAWAITLVIGNMNNLVIINERSWIALVSFTLAAIMGAYAARRWVYPNTTDLKKLKEPKHTLTLPSGSVRGFLILCMILMVISYVFFNMDVPLHFLIALNIILLYYEIKPEEVLPKQFVAEIPEKYGTIDRIPRVSTTIDNIEAKLEILCEEIDQELTKWTTRIEKLKEDINEDEKNAQNLIDKIKEKYEENENIKTLKKNLKAFYKFVDNFTVKGKTIIEQIGLMILLVSIGIFSIYYIESSGDPFNAITISFAAFLAAVAIAFGLNLQEILVKYMETPLSDAFTNVKKGINEVRNKINNYIDKAKDALEGVSKYQKNLKQEIENLLETFRNSNLLMILPKDIVACISINFIAYLCGIAVFIPTVYLTEYLLIGIEFVIGYYFMTKK
ncbi:MAG: hypothetical protein ACFFCV_16345, partial [Promethearchaeota archaeon]